MTLARSADRLDSIDLTELLAKYSKVSSENHFRIGNCTVGAYTLRSVTYSTWGGGAESARADFNFRELP